MKIIKRRMAEIISQHSGQPVEQIEADSERDRWFNAEEAMNYGLLDHVSTRRTDSPIAESALED